MVANASGAPIHPRRRVSRDSATISSHGPGARSAGPSQAPARPLLDKRTRSQPGSTITLSRGACSLVPSAGRIDLIAKAEDSERLASVEDAVGRHLVRFAAHEELTVSWAPLVRRASEADDRALLALDSTAWTPGSGFPSYRDRQRTAFFDNEKVPDHVLVAYIGGELVGYAGVMPKLKLPEAAHVFTVRGLVVAPGARRLGVASALLAAAERMAAERGARKLSLQVLGGNAAAMRLYERHGYAVEGRFVDEFLIDGRYVDDVNVAKII